MSRVRGVEWKYVVSLALVLALAMLTTVIVMLMPWQRDLVRAEALRGQAVLSLYARQSREKHDAAAPDGDKLRQELNKAVKAAGAICGAVRFNNRAMTAGPGSCNFTPLFSAMRQAAAGNKTVTNPLGVTWGVLVPRTRYLVVAVPVADGADRTGAAGLMLPLAPVYQSVRHSQRLVLACLLVNLIILTAIGLFRFHKLTVRPINRLVRLADSYHEPDDEAFPALPERSEFSRLSNALSRMLQRIERDRETLQATVHSLEQANQSLRDTQREMVRTEKMAAVGRLSAGLAHEIGNPLGIVQGYLELLCQTGISEDEKNEFSRRAEKELQRISTLLRQLLDLSRSLPDQYRPVSVHDILSELLSVMQLQPLTEGITIRSRLDASHDTVQGDPEQLRQVFLNCLLNSVDAVNASGRLRTEGRGLRTEGGGLRTEGDAVRASNNESGLIIVTTETVSANNTGEPAAKILVTIEDNGVGISPADLANVFDPFFTTKEPGKGTGLGLSVSLTIIEGMGGKIEIESRQSKGSRVLVRLPCKDAVPLTTYSD
ncbi:sensor protein ZraS [bacterium BMS3Bbin14]|nr:sensor protein ZraS [bacterium BMS3Bbin14]